MRRCPFCKADVKLEYPYLLAFTEGGFVFSHYCKNDTLQPSISVDVYGRTEQEIKDKWNGVYEEQKSESL